MKKLKGVCLGAGYFARFQYEAWNRLPEVEISALANRTRSKAEELAADFGIPHVYDWEDLESMFEQERPDFVDIITPPETHLEVTRLAAKHNIAIICQKPLAPTWEESVAVVEAARGLRFVVHENWRWQPWYREIKRQLEARAIGNLFSITVLMRMGDGWQEDAYMARQPFFRRYPRLLVYETGVHFLDTFRFLGGEIETIYARLQKRNPEIVGEDAGQIICGFANGGTAILDGSRYNEADTDDPRYTFGTVRLDGSSGHIELRLDGTLTIKLLGEPSRQISYRHERRNFAGDCVFNFQRHFVDCMLANKPFETTGNEYLKSVALVEAAYESASSGKLVVMK